LERLLRRVQNPAAYKTDNELRIHEKFSHSRKPFTKDESRPPSPERGKKELASDKYIPKEKKKTKEDVTYDVMKRMSDDFFGKSLGRRAESDPDF
jgi:hypothetical protein